MKISRGNSIRKTGGETAIKKTTVTVIGAKNATRSRVIKLLLKTL